MLAATFVALPVTSSSYSCFVLVSFLADVFKLFAPTSASDFGAAFAEIMAQTKGKNLLCSPFAVVSLSLRRRLFRTSAIAPSFLTAPIRFRFPVCTDICSMLLVIMFFLLFLIPCVQQMLLEGSSMDLRKWSKLILCAGLEGIAGVQGI